MDYSKTETNINVSQMNISGTFRNELDDSELRF